MKKNIYASKDKDVGVPAEIMLVDNAEDEVCAVCAKISSLISNGTNPSDSIK